MSDITIVTGRPGSGKTRYLMARVSKALEAGIPPERIGLVSFTKAAVTEAIERAAPIAMDALGGEFTHEDFPNFKTLHAMAFSLLGLRRRNVMGKQHSADFQRKTGIDVNSLRLSDGMVSPTAGSEAVYYDNLSRITGRPVQSCLEKYPPSFATVQSVADFSRVYTKFKAERGVVDFTDMVVMAAESDAIQVPELDLLLVDEAQDLSPVQWTLLGRLIARARVVHVVGDTNQAVYEWGGADPDRLLTMPGTRTALTQGYRMGRTIHRFAASVADRIKRRDKTEFLPAPHNSSVLPGRPLAAMRGSPQLRKGTWLVLARTHHILWGLRRTLGVTGSNVQYATFHAAKGREADGVIVCTDMSNRTHASLTRHPDEEWRALYVAVTRALRTLVLVDNGAKFCYPIYTR